MEDGRHRRLLEDALAHEAEGQRALMAGREDAARASFAQASDSYRRSWALAPPASYGRLVGMLKAAVLSGDADGAARFALAELGSGEPASPTSGYAQAIAGLVLAEPRTASEGARAMRAGSEPFQRAAEAVEALVAADGERYAAAVAAIVRDFEGRAGHLTGVAIADTAVMMQRLADPRGLRAAVASPLLPGEGPHPAGGGPDP